MLWHKTHHYASKIVGKLIIYNSSGTFDFPGNEYGGDSWDSESKEGLFAKQASLGRVYKGKLWGDNFSSGMPSGLHSAETPAHARYLLHC